MQFLFPKMSICLLSEREAFQLERHGLPPNCKNNHRHISYDKAQQLAADQAAKWVGSNPERLVLLPPRVWRPVNSVLQLVEGVIQGRKGRFSCPAPARGGRDRDTSVLKINAPRPIVPAEALA